MIVAILGLCESSLAVYSATLGRFLTKDPNETALTLSPSTQTHGQEVRQTICPEPDLVRQYRDGLGLYQYVASSPIGHTDASGLRVDYAIGIGVPDPSDYIFAALEFMVDAYVENLGFDVYWSTSWHLPDDDHSRTESGWISFAIAEGVYDAFWVGAGQYGFNPLDLMCGTKRAPAAGGRSGARKVRGGETIHTKRGRDAHKEYAKEMDAKGWDTEVWIPGVGRVDAIKKKECLVREYKPNTPSGRYRGRRQLFDYIDRLEKKFGKTWYGYIDYYGP
jgi:hypothetical protein